MTLQRKPNTNFAVVELYRNSVQHFQLITVTHRQASLQQIGKFVLTNLPDSTVLEQLNTLKTHFSLEGICYLATCNRVFFWLDTPQPVHTPSFLKKALPNLPDDLIAHTSLYEGPDALKHLLEVASSIDSLVVGEREILRQLREAYEWCKNNHLTNDNMRLAMRIVVEHAKNIYTNTQISERPVSVVSLALKKMTAALPNTNSHILLVGAGQTNQLVAKLLLSYGYTHVQVFNRTLAPAQKIADTFGTTAHHLADLIHYRQPFDALIVCTGATQPIITQPLFEALTQGNTAPKVLIDLSVPNNTSPEVAQLPHIHYIEVETLRHLAAENHKFREQEVAKVRLLIHKALDESAAMFRQRHIERAMSQLPEQIKAIKSHTINEVFRKEIETLDDTSRHLVEKMLNYMEKKCIGLPMATVRKVLLETQTSSKP